MLNYFDIILNRYLDRAMTQRPITQKNERTIIKFQIYLFI